MLSAKVIEDFREQTEEHFHPVDGMNTGEIEEMVSYYVQAKIIENKLDVKVENVILSGSRCRGIEKIGSDLDVVVVYKGTIREDDFFNILHEEGFADCRNCSRHQSYHGGQDRTVDRVSGISGTVSEGEGSREKTGKDVCERKNKTGETNSTGKEKSEYGKVKK